VPRAVRPGRADLPEETFGLDAQLHPGALRKAADSGQGLTLRMQPGDHSDWFIQTLMSGHIAHHAAQLLA